MTTGSVAAGMGIHTGEAVVGAVGAREREEFVAIGPAVDLAFGLSEAEGGAGW